MSVRIMNKVWDAKLSRPEKYILLCLADFSNDEGESIYPSLRYIAWKTGYKETQARDILQALSAKGIISTRKQASKYGTNEYTIHIDHLPVRDPYSPPKKGRPEKTGAKTEPGNGENEKTGAVFRKRGVETEPDPSVDSSVNPSEKERAPAIPETGDSHKKPDLLDGMVAYSQKAQGRVDVSAYPEEVQGVIEKVCQLWGLTPPLKPKGGGGQFAEWIRDARYLMQAGGGLTLRVLDDLKANPYEWMKTAMIARPGALIKAVNARAGDLRTAETSGYTGGWTPESLAEMKEKIRAIKAAQIVDEAPV